MRYIILEDLSFSTSMSESVPATYGHSSTFPFLSLFHRNVKKKKVETIPKWAFKHVLWLDKNNKIFWEIFINFVGYFNVQKDWQR